MPSSRSPRQFHAVTSKHCHRRSVYMIGVLLILVQMAAYHVMDANRTEAFTENKAYTKLAHDNPVRIPDDWIPLLDKPFYIYDELLMIDGATLAGQKRSLRTLVRDSSMDWSEYSQDLWFTLAALEHPMRTRNPALAQLFVVPFLTHLVAESSNLSFCWEGLCGKDVVEYADEILRRSPYLKEKPHIVVATHPDAPRILQGTAFAEHCHVLGLENQQFNAVDKLTVPTIHFGHVSTCKTKSKKPVKLHVPDLKSYKDVCQALECTVDVCKGHLGWYPAKATSTSLGHLWGDVRLENMLLSDTIPIFTNHSQYKALPDWIDWDQISYFLEEKENLPALVTDTLTYESKRTALQENRDLIDWTTIVPFDTYMFMLARQLLVQRKEDHQRQAIKPQYSALKLDTLVHPTRKQVWCGEAGYANSCSECPTNFGEYPSNGCQGTCHWCDYGITENPLSSAHPIGGNDSNRCFARPQRCHEPDLETIVKDLARPSTPYEGDPLGFCVEDDDSEDTNGILLAKTFKTASTTAAAVSIHLAERVARRRGLKSRRCKHQVHHKFSRRNLPKTRQSPSVLWTSVREPGSRALSAYYFYRVGRKEVEPTDEKTIKFLNSVKNHQFVQLRTQRGYASDGGYATDHQIHEDSDQLYARILREEIIPLYDFVAVTERMDESLVVLKMLWGLDTGDIIVSAAKAGEWSYNWNPKGTCFKIARTHQTDGVLDYIKTDFRSANGDFLLHAVANRSLDMTIDALGRDDFDREFAQYKALKTATTSICQSNATFPCSKTGQWQPQFKEDCYEYDVGCGYRCIDNLLDKYEKGEFALDI